MPVNIGKEGDSSFTGLTGNFHAKPTEIADKLVEGKEGRPDAIRVVFKVEGKDDTLSLFVPLHESAADRLHPFIAGVKDIPTDEAGMRAYLVANMPSDTFFVYANNGSVRGVTAPPGRHRIQLTGLNQFVRKDDGQVRVRFFAETKNRETVTWTVPYDAVIAANLGKTPKEDDLQLNPNKFLIEYLMAFGLDYWERFNQEITDAYENGHLFTRLGLDGSVPGFFDNPGDLTDELFQAAHRHSPNRWCEVKVVDHPQYGIGPERGAYSHIEFTPIIVEGSTEDAEFNREVALFLELWGNVTKAVLSKDNARFIASGDFTEDGKVVAMATLVPLVRAHPAAVTQRKEDGITPAVFPPSPETWTLDGLVAANFTAERLLALSQEDLFKTVNLSDPTGFMAWAAEHVPEWAGVGQEREAEAL